VSAKDRYPGFVTEGHQKREVNEKTPEPVMGSKRFNSRKYMERIGFEPMTSRLQTGCSPS
jgi:hypothetical protein